jgi:hypothetical protein
MRFAVDLPAETGSHRNLTEIGRGIRRVRLRAVEDERRVCEPAPLCASIRGMSERVSSRDALKQLGTTLRAASCSPEASSGATGRQSPSRAGPSRFRPQALAPRPRGRLYLPRGPWFDFWTEEKLERGHEIDRTVDLKTMPLRVCVGRRSAARTGEEYAEETVESPPTLVV